MVGVCSPPTLSRANRGKSCYPASPQSDRRHSWHICAAHQPPQPHRGAKYAQNPFDLRENDHFLVRGESFRGGHAGRRSPIFLLLEGVKNGTSGAVISAAPVHVRWGDVGGAAAAQGRVRFAWRRAALSGSPQIKLLHIGGTIPAAVMNYRLNTSPLPQRPRLVFIRLHCFLSDINLVDTVCFKKVSVREQPLELRENGLVGLLRLLIQSTSAGWLFFTLSLNASYFQRSEDFTSPHDGRRYELHIT